MRNSGHKAARSDGGCTCTRIISFRGYGYTETKPNAQRGPPHRSRGRAKRRGSECFCCAVGTMQPLPYVPEEKLSVVYDDPFALACDARTHECSTALCYRRVKFVDQNWSKGDPFLPGKAMYMVYGPICGDRSGLFARWYHVCQTRFARFSGQARGCKDWRALVLAWTARADARAVGTTLYPLKRLLSPNVYAVAGDSVQTHVLALLVNSPPLDLHTALSMSSSSSLPPPTHERMATDEDENAVVDGTGPDAFLARLGITGLWETAWFVLGAVEACVRHREKHGCPRECTLLRTGNLIVHDCAPLPTTPAAIMREDALARKRSGFSRLLTHHRTRSACERFWWFHEALYDSADDAHASFATCSSGTEADHHQDVLPMLQRWLRSEAVKRACFAAGCPDVDTTQDMLDALTNAVEQADAVSLDECRTLLRLHARYAPIKAGSAVYK